jgi:F0F1-type ATP synthase assembly protein I
MAILDEPQGSINESAVNIQPVVVKWGLISAGFGIIFQLLFSMFGMSNLLLMFLMLIIGLIIGIYILVLAVRADRDEQLGGYATFKRVFLVAFLVMLISIVITQVFNFLYMNYINPSAADATLEATRSMMEKMGANEDDLEKALEKAAAQIEESKKPAAIFMSLIKSSIVGAIFAAIFGAIMKKEKPLFN